MYYKAQKLRHLLRQQILEALSRVDVLVMPTSPAPRIPARPGINSKEDALSRISGVRSFTGPFNLAGVPALSVPCGYTSDGLPISLQLAGRPLGEETLLRLAYAYEQSTPWHTRRPAI